MKETETTMPAGCAECQAGAATLAAGPETPPVHGLDRRTFVTQSALATVTALLATACGGGAGPTGPGGNGPITGLTVNVSSFPTLATVGGIARVDQGRGTPIAVVRTGAASFDAFSLICPHFGCTVGITGSTTGAAFQCPCHGAMFSSTGAWVGGQRTSGLRAIAATYDATAGTLTLG